MSTDLVLHSTSEAFSLAELICKSPLVPQAYRGKPVDAAVAMLYGAEIGFPPMTALQRIVVINGKPSCDAQGMVSLIRQAGHSISGDVSATTGAKVTGKRGDNGDTMTVEWGPADAERARLGGDTYRKFPADMYWARAVSQLGRRLFADVLLSVSYVPEEAEAIPVNGNGRDPVRQMIADAGPPEDSAWASNGHGVDSTPAPRPQLAERKVRQPPGTPQADADTGEIIDAEVVEDAPDPATVVAVADPGQRASTQQVNKIKRLLKLPDDAAAKRVGDIVNRAVTDLAELTDAEARTALAELEAQ